ncbi:MAG: N-acetylmuramoyl-L-alanine amidase [Betaproteobacteria bacterium]|nr:N-acetylmuramoyl-L-alanine amidase [Betaproteobacteria bacterium]
MQITRALSVFTLVALSACTTPPAIQHTTLPVSVRLSANFDERRPNYVIVHYTSSDTADRALRTLTDPASKVSAHYLIASDGKIYSLVDERARAWHAGVSYWGGNRDVNSTAIGIELDNNGRDPFAAPLIDALGALLGDLKERFSIPTANFLGHSDVAPRRKVDPGALFPWRELAARGFGVWCDPPYRVPPAADGATLLAAFGYDTADEAAAVSAFKLHFVPDGDPRELTDGDRALLACLIEQKRTIE